MKRFLKKLILLIIISFGLIIVFNYIIDPYQYFRAPKIYKMINMDSRYLNSGLIKNQEYDTIILGTSMTENISIKELKEKFNFKAIKLSNPAARLPDIKRNLESVNRHRNINNIIYGLDIYTFNEDKDYMKAYVPNYLYQEFTLDIIFEYLLNFLTILDSIKIIGNNIIGETRTLDDLYSWYNDKQNLDNLKEVKKDYQLKDEKNQKTLLSSKEIFEKMKVNYNYNLKPILEKNRDKNIIIYFTPYSILAYKLWEKEGLLLGYSDFEKYLCEEFLTYSNINVYYFKNDKNLTHNLMNFYDVQHHTEKVNSKILQDIKSDKNKIQLENYANYIDEWYNQVQEYHVEDK